MKNYTTQFKEEALMISDKKGLRKACNKLGIPYGTLSGWRKIQSWNSNEICKNGM